jgi:hypothetical protein
VSAGDLAAVLVAVVCLIAVVVLTAAALALVRTVRALRTVVDELRSQAVPMVTDLRAAVAQADSELDRVAGLLDQAEEIGAQVEATTRLANRAFAPPIIKTLSLAAGLRRASRRLRGLGDGRPIEARAVDHTAVARTARRRARATDEHDRSGAR